MVIFQDHQLPEDQSVSEDDGVEESGGYEAAMERILARLERLNRMLDDSDEDQQYDQNYD